MQYYLNTKLLMDMNASKTGLPIDIHCFQLYESYHTKLVGDYLK